MIALLLALLAAPAFPYQREDHNTSVRIALDALRPRPEGDAVVGLCAQLPDESAELAAIDVYRRLMRHPADFARWALLGRGPAETVGRMAAVQQLLHGLTSGDPAGVRAVAESLVAQARADARAAKTPQQRADALCAEGFALHLYGDSFAHARIRNGRRMYPTGIGHFFDMTRPDLPLATGERFELWASYMRSLPSLVPDARAGDLQEVLTAAREPAREAREGNHFNEDAFRRILNAALEKEGARPTAPFDRRLERAGCQAVLDAAAKASGLLPAPSCAAVWTRHRDRAAAAFDAYDAAHPAAPARAQRTAYFLGDLFAQGANW